MRHSALIAVVSLEDVPALKLGKLRKKLAKLDEPGVWRSFADLLVGPVASIANRYATVLFVPDGSKEGWETSGRGDAARELVVAHFRKHGVAPDLFEFSFGGDWGGVDVETLVLGGNVDDGSVRRLL